MWALWRLLRSRAGTEASVDRLRELGVARSTVYRHLGDFRQLFGGRGPDEVDAGELVDVLRRRQQGQLFPTATTRQGG